MSDKLSVVKKDESFSLKPSVILPPKPESFSVVVTAYDQRLDLVYKFAITGNASEPFQVEPKIIHLVPNGSQSINLKIVELFPTEAIKDFSLVPTGVVVGSRALSRDSLEVTLDPAFVPIQTVSESFFMEINGVSGSKTRISIPVRIAGRKSITPNVVSLRRSGSKLTYFFVLSGFEDDLSASDLTVSVVGLGGLQLRGSIDSLKKRAVGTYSVGGSIDGLNGVDVLEAASSKILRVEDTKRNWVQEVKLLVY